MDDLGPRYLLPIVKRVVPVKDRFGTVDLGVETSHVFQTFTMRSMRENVVQASPNWYLLSDIDGNHMRCRILTNWTLLVERICGAIYNSIRSTSHDD
jgi:hypothetical protein